MGILLIRKNQLFQYIKEITNLIGKLKFFSHNLWKTCGKNCEFKYVFMKNFTFISF